MLCPDRQLSQLHSEREGQEGLYKGVQICIPLGAEGVTTANAQSGWLGDLPIAQQA